MLLIFSEKIIASGHRFFFSRIRIEVKCARGPGAEVKFCWWSSVQHSRQVPLTVRLVRHVPLVVGLVVSRVLVETKEEAEAPPCACWWPASCLDR